MIKLGGEREGLMGKTGGQALPPEMMDGTLQSPQTSSGSPSCPAPLGLGTPGLPWPLLPHETLNGG